MIELKAYIAPTPDGKGLADYYLKSEADKVLADKDKDIQRLEKLCESYRIDCDNLAISDEQAKRAARTLLKKMNHNKRKRCLAMARWCNERIVRIEKDYAFWRYGKDYAQNFYKKWELRWLAIAEKFKEAK